MGVDVNEGASRIAQLLQPEQPSDSAQEPEEAAQPETVEDTVETTESEHYESEAVESEAPETQEAEAESDTESEPLYTVKVNGEEREVPLEDLRKGYMMEADYRKKTSEISKQREEFKVKQDEFSQKLNDVEQLLIADIEDLNSEENLELKDLDPEAYYKKREKLEARARKFQDMQQEKVKIEQARDAESSEKEKELLLSALPEWLDQDTQNKEVDLINKLWSDVGYTPEEISRFKSHKDVLIARKAALYDQIKSAKPESKKVKTKPKSAKPGASKSVDKPTGMTDARSKLKKTGNVRDAQAAIKSILKG